MGVVVVFSVKGKCARGIGEKGGECRKKGTYRMGRCKVKRAGEVGAVSWPSHSVSLEEFKVYRILLVWVECTVGRPTARKHSVCSDRGHESYDVPERLDYEVGLICLHGLSQVCDCAS